MVKEAVFSEVNVQFNTISKLNVAFVVFNVALLNRMVSQLLDELDELLD